MLTQKHYLALSRAPVLMLVFVALLLFAVALPAQAQCVQTPAPPDCSITDPVRVACVDNGCARVVGWSQ